LFMDECSIWTGALLRMTEGGLVYGSRQHMDGSATTNDTQCNYRLKSAFFRAVDFLRVTGV
jgi:hypothetical protein